ncbi:hypothetical protein C2S53_011004 [Perilla frutescens var. hirtella]|uniref:Uncharacterized protein n=1 Tax=Perilla frutescens var. hirtella TaxID=608512 RepID=A0AAD4JDF2_PERFH|nr:hypothetical protein C2S53_011004 [Perilla frutescens var. hirtella]
MSNEKGDVEAALLYPSMQENPARPQMGVYSESVFDPHRSTPRHRRHCSRSWASDPGPSVTPPLVVANPPIAIFFISWGGLTFYLAIVITLVIEPSSPQLLSTQDFHIVLRLSLLHSLVIFFPMRRIYDMIYSGIVVLIFSVYIIYDTDQLIKRHSYDQYIWASIRLYLDILKIFVRLLQFLRAVNR